MTADRERLHPPATSGSEDYGLHKAPFRRDETACYVVGGSLHWNGLGVVLSGTEPSLRDRRTAGHRPSRRFITRPQHLRINERTNPTKAVRSASCQRYGTHGVGSVTRTPEAMSNSPVPTGGAVREYERRWASNGHLEQSSS